MDLRKGLNIFLSWLAGISFTLAIGSLILEYGFDLQTISAAFHQVQLISALCLAIVFLLRLIIARSRLAFARANRGYLVLIVLFLIIIYLIRWSQLSIFPGEFKRFPGHTSESIAVQIYLGLYVLFSFSQINRLITTIRGTILRPILLIPLTFIFIILIGTILLLLPKAIHQGEKISFIDALFTATSATCVTGLIVKDTGLYFSRMGQLIILILLQIGGLGIMTFTTFFGFMLGRRLGVREQAFLGEALSLKGLARIGQLVLGILAFTFVVEIIGAGLLWYQFLPYFGPNLHNFYLSVFHAVSAFCNAGFSLFSDSFQGFLDHAGINFIMTTLIILGGLGFLVIFDILGWARSHFRKERKSLSLHSKMVLSITLALIIIGSLFIFAREYSHALGQFSIKEKLLASYFQSVTARTAGFSTLSIADFAPFTVLLLMLFMFIGASPGSTGGGIKNSTFGIVVMSLKNWLLGRRSVGVFQRTIPHIVVRQAFCVFFLALSWILFSFLILVQTEEAPFLDILFEAMSAFGTVGLSRGITFGLTLIGKIVIIVTMFIGRLSPLIIALYVAGRGIEEKYTYPEEKIVVG